MSSRMHPSETYLALKAAQKRLVRQIGGVEACASLTRVGKASLGFYTQLEHEQHMPADVIVDLEAHYGEPWVTRELARKAGYELVPIGTAVPPPAVDPVVMVVGLSREVGDFARSVEDMDADGVREPHEIRRCLAELGDLIQKAERYKTDMHRHLAGSRSNGEEG